MHAGSEIAAQVGLVCRRSIARHDRVDERHHGTTLVADATPAIGRTGTRRAVADKRTIGQGYAAGTDHHCAAAVIGSTLRLVAAESYIGQDSSTATQICFDAAASAPAQIVISHVVGKSAVRHRQRAQVLDTAAVVGAVAGEGAVRHIQPARAEDTAAPLCAVAGEGAVRHRQRARTTDAATGAACTPIVREGAVRHRQRTIWVENAAADAPLCAVAGEGAVQHVDHDPAVL